VIYTCPHSRTTCRRTGNSIGGVVEVVARNVPSGLGSPAFEKLEAELAKACMSLPASKGFEVRRPSAICNC
jgi:chorismate synthase